MPVSSIIDLLRRLSVWLFWPGLLVVIWGELKPGTSSPDIHLWDKLLHFTAYFGLALMATLAMRARRPIAWVVFWIIVFGGVLEIVQSFVGRDAEVLDEVANTMGALTGWALGWGLFILHGKLVGMRRPA
jgi:VanZ family protein